MPNGIHKRTSWGERFSALIGLSIRKVWRSLNTLFSRRSSLPQLVFHNKRQVTSALIAIVLIASYDRLHYLFAWIFSLSAETTEHYQELLRTLSAHSIFALSVYSLFGRRIERWLGYKLKESWRFNAHEFLLKVRLSQKEVRICETFIESLLTKYEADFVSALEVFIENARQNGHTPTITILLLEPYCDAAKERIKELQPFYRQKKRFPASKASDEHFTQVFQRETMWTLLVKLDNIKARLLHEFRQDNDGKQTIRFVIRLFKKKPPYSLYFCDKYASFGYHRERPSTEYRQLIFLDTSSEAVQFQLEAFEDLWKTATDLPDNYANKPPCDVAIIDDFKRVVKEPTIDGIFHILASLGHECEKHTHKLYDLIRFVEETHQKRHTDPHFNIFGTGGDRNKTINITTMAAILASHYHDAEISSLPIKKVGTLAVTSAVGSQQFYDVLQAKLLEKDKMEGWSDVKQPDWLDFNRTNESIYLPVLFFGYIYYDIIRAARRRIDTEGILDIYKIVFPCANLTGYTAVVNGVSQQVNVRYFQEVYREFKKTGIIINNQRDSIDEMYMGQNHLLYYRAGHEEFDEVVPVDVPADKRASYREFFEESSAEEHVKKFVSLFDKKTDRCIKETICYNIALLLKLYYLQDSKYDVDTFRSYRIEDLKNRAFQHFFA